MTTTTVLFANDATSNLAGSISNVATTANLTPGSGVLFPSPGANEYFVGTFVDAATGLIKEIVHVTGVSSDTITMVRAQEGTTALAWSAGDLFSNLLTAGTADIFRQTGIPIDLTADVSGVLPLSNLPASDTSGGLPVMKLNAGNPNGSVAGNANVNGASDFCWDTTNSLLYVCTTTGDAAGAVWTVTIGQTLPPGAMVDFGGTAAPTGYLGCDGTAVSRTTYAALFSAIGTTWGVGDGSTTFNVPDFRRRTAVGSGGTGTGTLGNAVGNTGGEETHVLTVPEIPGHTHTTPTANSTGAGGVPASAGTSTPDSTPITGSTGGGGGHNNIQPSAVVLKIIKT